MDMPTFRAKFEAILARATAENMPEAQFVAELENGIESSHQSTDNKHSSQFYRSIQFTARQLVKLKNPLYEDLRELKALTKKQTVSPDVQKLAQNIDLQYIQREVRFFYPYEVQIVDFQTHKENEQGRGAHSEYKKAQTQTAMARVMGSLTGN